MSIFNKGVNIGKTMAGRVVDFPVFRKEPKKKSPRWVEVPDFTVKPPKKIGPDEEQRDYSFKILIFSEDRGELRSMLDYMIGLGAEEIETDRAIFWLHAVQHSVHRVRGKNLFQANLGYIFRVKPVPEPIL